MNSFLYQTCCYWTTLSSYANVSAREMEHDHRDNGNRFGRLVINQAYAIALGAIMYTADEVMTQKPANNLIFMFIPNAIALSISGLAYLAHRKKCCSREMNAIDRNLGKVMDKLCLISQVAVLILLAPQARKGPVEFGEATISLGLNLLHAGYYAFRSESQQQTGQSEA